MSAEKTYLITGASGFIGACLLRRLVSMNQKVHIILRKDAKLWRIKDLLNKVEVHTDDLSDADRLSVLVKRILPDVIYHLATYGAYSFQMDEEMFFQTNIRGTLNLLKATAGVQYDLFVNTGSSSEYGFKGAAMKETDFLEPASYYAVTKSSQTLLCSYFARAQKKPVVTFRPFSVYGPYEESTRFILTLMNALYSGKAMDLVDPHIVRDWIYVDDIVDMYLMTEKLKRFGGCIFNSGTGVQHTIREVVEKAVAVTGRNTTFHWGSMAHREWDTDCWVSDISRAKELLNWTPKVDLEAGLLLTWKWFNEHRDLYL